MMMDKTSVAPMTPEEGGSCVAQYRNGVVQEEEEVGGIVTMKRWTGGEASRDMALYVRMILRHPRTSMWDQRRRQRRENLPWRRTTTNGPRTTCTVVQVPLLEANRWKTLESQVRHSMVQRAT